MSWRNAPFRQSGTPLMHSTFAPATSATLGPPFFLGSAYGSWAIRVRLTGAGTSGQVQLLGTLASSSQAASSGAFRPFTTWDGAVNTSDDVVIVAAKPLTAVLAYLSTPSSSATSIDVWIAGSA